MTEEIKSEDSKEGIKDAFWRIMNRETIELMETFLTSKAIFILGIIWLLVSLSGSIYRRVAGTCPIKMQINSYFMADLLCPIQ